jgi:hypothetical protein
MSRKTENPGLPFMMPAAFMDTAWASQPDPLMALMGEISRHLVQVEGWVPKALDELVVRVRQRYLPLVVKTHACDRRSKQHIWLLEEMLSVACLPIY